MATITTNVTDLEYTDSEDLRTATVEVTTDMNLSEEIAESIAQHALSTELGCDLERVLEWETFTENDGITLTVTFANHSL